AHAVCSSRRESLVGGPESSALGARVLARGRRRTESCSPVQPATHGLAERRGTLDRDTAAARALGGCFGCKHPPGDFRAGAALGNLNRNLGLRPDLPNQPGANRSKKMGAATADGGANGTW